ncbi:unnamed protein product, partial [Schistosoma curassoni]|uniref:RGS domain-containing protein n=1 Tax=Schistosoma curassoni TaxID=6186 RepID=A0A183KX32_9TREM
MELENIVANTVYIKAKRSGADGDKGRSRKWKTLLAFPHISNCLYLKNCLDLSYDFIVEQQPIGKRLFRLFCRSNNFISDVVDFVDSICFVFFISRTHLRCAFLTNVKRLGWKSTAGFSQTCGKRFHQLGNIDDNSVLNALEESNDAYPDKELFRSILKILEDFLRNSPFSEFLNSVYFNRYLQWKWLEKTPVTK